MAEKPPGSRETLRRDRAVTGNPRDLASGLCGLLKGALNEGTITGGILTRVTIWLAVACWALVMAGRCRGREMPGALPIWFVGLGAYVAHVIAAFEFHYHWSHLFALAETGRQTAALTGVDSGAGLWLNYLLGAIWAYDAARWAVTGHPRGAFYRTWHAFLAFMIFNGTVVFGQGPVRWFGLAVFTCLAALWLRAKLSTSPSEP